MTRHSSMQAMLARRDRLEPADEARVAAHIQACPECRKRAVDYTSQTAFLRSFRREAAPPGLREGLLTLVDQRISDAPDKPHSSVQGQRSRGLPRGAWQLLPSGSRLRWPGIALAAILAIAVAVLSPIVIQRTASPASADQLLRSAAQIAQTLPSSGTATVTYLGAETPSVPDYLVTHRLVETWSATDDQRYRIDEQTVEPAIDSGTLTTIRDGSTVTRYDTRTETASVSTQTGPFPDYFTLAGGAPMGGVAPGTSIQQYLDSTQQGIPASVPHFARIVGKARLLGRPVDVVAFAPVVSGIKCVPKGQSATDCNTPLDYGTATVWIDDATHFVLKYQADLADPHSFIRRSVFEVTSFTPGQGATQAQLSERPPVPVQPLTHPSIGTSGFGGGPSGPGAHVPPGFIAAPTPSELSNAGWAVEVVSTWPLGDVTGINILFNPNAKPNVTYGYVPGDHFVLVEERIRAHGLPTALQVGTPVRAGTCQAWEGTTSDGLPTLAFARGNISVLMTSNSLFAGDLVSYAAQNMCP